MKDGVSTSASSPTVSHDILHSRASSPIASPTASHDIFHNRASSPTASHDILHSRASSPTASHDILHSRDGSNIVATDTIKNKDGASTAASSPTASHAASPTASHDILPSRASSPTASQNILHSRDGSNIVATDTIKNTTSTIPKDELEAALEGASMENKTLIIAVANKACTEEGSFLDLLLQSFQVGEGTQLLSNHLLLAAIDQTAFEQCNMRKLHCYKLMTDGVDFSGEKTFMSSDYLKITWMKTLFQATVVRRGYNFIFTDMDVIWLRNPFERLVHQGVDLQISCDFYNGNPSDTAGNAANTGFYFVVSNNKTISMFDKWYAARNDSMRLHDQHVLQALLRDGLSQQLDMKVRFLDPLYFGGFCVSGRNYGKVVTMHSNCCTSFSAKMRGLRAILDGWIKFKGQSNDTSSVQWPA